MKKVIVYSTPTCPHCINLKKYLNEKKVPVENYDVSQNQAKAQEMKKKSGQMGVPVIDIEGKIITGFDQSTINQELGL